MRKILFFGGMQGELNESFCTLHTGMELMERQLQELKKTESVERIHRNMRIMRDTLWRVEHISSCINDVLLGCAGTLEPCMVDVEICEMVRVAADFVHSEIQNRQWLSMLECNLPEQSVWVCADENYAEQILSILLTNALRCGQADTRVQIALDPDERKLTVTDDSPQIPENAIAAILEDKFEEKFVEDSSLLGLQLYLARLYCDAMSWELEITSDLNQTCVSVRMTPNQGQRQRDPVFCSASGQESYQKMLAVLRRDFDGAFGTCEETIDKEK